jgi:hypothetical protein
VAKSLISLVTEVNNVPIGKRSSVGLRYQKKNLEREGNENMQAGGTRRRRAPAKGHGARSNGAIGDAAVGPMSDPRSWARNPGTYIAGRAFLDEADGTAALMEARWGVDRLRLLVGPELREKFDRQRYLLNQAIWHGELEDVRRESLRMASAWRKLDQDAKVRGAKPLDPMVWEVAVPCIDEHGASIAIVAAIVPDAHHAHKVIAEGRKIAVYTLEEIGRLLHAFPAIAKAKQTWPGATVTATRKSVDDPLDGLHDSAKPLDDPLDDLEF